jgi:spore coat protein U-like protein
MTMSGARVVALRAAGLAWIWAAPSTGLRLWFVGARKRRSFNSLLVVVVSLVLFPPVARAVSCTVSVPSVNFGSLPGPGTLPGSIPITVVCPSGMTFYVGNDAGQNALGNYGWRLAGPSSNFISYGLYQDSARTVLSGGTIGYDEASAVGTGSSQIVYLYPKTLAHTSIPGTYTDSVQIRVTVSGTLVTAQMAITATVTSTCAVSANALNFGNYSGAQIDTTTVVTVTCTNSTAWYVNMNDGQQSGSGYVPQMVGPGGALLSYSKFRDTARTLYWGNTYNYDGVGGTGTGLAQPLTAYARLFGGAYVRPGAYSDTISVTVTY